MGNIGSWRENKLEFLDRKLVLLGCGLVKVKMWGFCKFGYCINYDKFYNGWGFFVFLSL